MNYNHTPTTEEVRQHWTDIGFGGDGPSFDRWHAETIRQAKEAAWNKAHDIHAGPIENCQCKNPYRSQE